MSAEFDFDIIIIGAGPAGESAALNASKHGLKVAVVDNLPEVGGSCTHSGTIPSKALRSAVSSYLRFQQNPLINKSKTAETLKFQDLRINAQGVIQKQVDMRNRFYLRNKIELLKGHAEFVDAHTICIKQQDEKTFSISAANIILATGSRPYRPDEINFNHSRIYDSDTILNMDHTPRKLIIYGAGVIGCEYASIFSNLGIKVDLVNTRDHLLEFLDVEISDALSYHLTDQGVIIRHREEFDHVETRKDGITLHLQSGKRIKADALLWCNGRTGNTDQLNLKVAGLEANHRGQLEVNEDYQTSVDHISAAGDIVGWPSLAGAAYNQGASAAAFVRGKKAISQLDQVPTGIYTLPEISSVGKTERELTDAKIPYEVGRAFFKDTARGQISGQNVGMLKILFHIDTHAILGIHCFGDEATEIIHIGQAILKQPGEHNTIRYFVNTTFNYPTMAEAYRIAALNGLNRLGE
ncbi:MAG: Si-specific NAD(P)(+) transhydrogenase [Pseudomonadales bacterium]|nr:Si-specific NAD(P)(+) transhydrogenase [Pseudomonadales bacterium]